MECVERGWTVRAGGGQPRIGRVRLRRGRASRSIVSHALRAWFWRSARSRWASVSSRDDTSPARSRAASSWPCRRVRSADMLGRGPSVAAEDRRHDDEVAVARWRVREHRLDGERRRDDVVAQDVLELDRLGGRRDLRRSQLGQLRVLVEDVVELALEAVELVVGQAEAGEVARRARRPSGSGRPPADDSRRDDDPMRPDGRTDAWHAARDAIGPCSIAPLGRRRDRRRSSGPRDCRRGRRGRPSSARRRRHGSVGWIGPIASTGASAAWVATAMSRRGRGRLPRSG